MTSLRSWRLTSKQPLSLQIAADTRLRPTDYTDDQVWQLQLGEGESPALALQTRYGGRVGLASLVPMVTLERRPIYQQQAYVQPPTVTAFAPGYLRTQAKLTPELALQADFFVLDSHSVSGTFSLKNTGKRPLEFRLEIIGFLATEGKEHRLGVLPLTTGGHALLLGQAGNLYPAVVMQDGSADGLSASKIGVTLMVGANKSASVQWVHVGLPDLRASVAQAQEHLRTFKPSALLDEIRAAAEDLPVIETGDLDTDATIAFSGLHLMQSFLRPTASLPHASFVGARQPGRGFSPNGSGTDHIRAWSGQNPTLAYLLALGVAPVDAALAEGIVRNYLAVQRDDGWIDWKPGLAGQRQGLLCLPVLARLAWGIFHYTENDQFLRDVYPGLLKFAECWLKMDADGDGLPEWQSEVQTGYPFMPTFALGLAWGQNADIRLVEAPDLAAYLLSELITLREIAWYLRDSETHASLEAVIEALRERLERLWSDGRYHYQDRDTHASTASVTLLDDGYGDEEHFIAQPLSPPNRVTVRVTGGMEHIPNMQLSIDGHDADGKPIQERAEAADFLWTHGRGVYTTRSLFSNVDRLALEGLVRVYRVSAHTVDTTRLDLSAILPLWSVGLTPERAAELVALLKAEFWRETGVTMCASSDPQFDPSNAEGAGGVWAFWLTLIGEGLLEYGYLAEAAELVKKMIAAQVVTLRQARAFHEFYHADEPRGLGERGSAAGIVPLHLLLRVLGVRIISPGKVWAGGIFHWGSAVSISHRGVKITRSADGTLIRFPSGNTVDLPPDAPFQEITDTQ